MAEITHRTRAGFVLAVYLRAFQQMLLQVVRVRVEILTVRAAEEILDIHSAVVCRNDVISQFTWIAKRVLLRFAAIIRTPVSVLVCLEVTAFSRASGRPDKSPEWPGDSPESKLRRAREATACRWRGRRPASISLVCLGHWRLSRLECGSDEFSTRRMN